MRGDKTQNWKKKKKQQQKNNRYIRHFCLLGIHFVSIHSFWGIFALHKKGDKKDKRNLKCLQMKLS